MYIFFWLGGVDHFTYLGGSVHTELLHFLGVGQLGSGKNGRGCGIKFGSREGGGTLGSDVTLHPIGVFVIV